MALAEEERDSCNSCGMPKVWCRDPEHQFSFDAEESVCWPTYRLAQRRGSSEFEGRDQATKAATQLAARFRDGKEPDFTAGLGLPDEGDKP